MKINGATVTGAYFDGHDFWIVTGRDFSQRSYNVTKARYEEARDYLKTMEEN